MTELTPEGQRLETAMVEAGAMGRESLLSPKRVLALNTAAALLLTAPEGEEAGLREAIEDAIRGETYTQSPDVFEVRGVEEAATAVLALLPSLTKQPAAQEPSAAGVDRTDWIKHGAVTEMADAAFAVHATAPSQAQMNRLHTAAERLLDLRAAIATLTPAAPKTPDAATGGSVGDGVRDALKEITEAADGLLNTLPGHWHDDATIRLTDAANDARTTLKAAEQEDLYEPPAPVGEDETGVREALAWYGEQARLARLIHSEGDSGRHALSDDGGKRAAAALAPQPPKAETPAGVGELIGSEDAYIARVLAMSSDEIRAEAEAVGVEIPPPRSLSASLRNLRFRLESALANRLEEGDREAIGWLNEGIIAIGAALSTAPAARPGDEVQIALKDCADAVAFFDQVKAASDAEQIAVGRDHWNWIEASCRRAAALAAAPDADGGRS